jgi:RimJ/RimL family protein N-acetyltransferase
MLGMQHPPEQFLGSRVMLRRAKPEDSQALFLIASEPEVLQYMDWPAPSSATDILARHEKDKARWENGAEYKWVILKTRGQCSFSFIYRS